MPGAKLRTSRVSSADRTGTEVGGAGGRETTGTCPDPDLSLGERNFALQTELVWLPAALYSDTLYCAPQPRTARATMRMPIVVRNEVRRDEASICIAPEAFSIHAKGVGER